MICRSIKSPVVIHQKKMAELCMMMMNTSDCDLTDISDWEWHASVLGTTKSSNVMLIATDPSTSDSSLE